MVVQMHYVQEISLNQNLKLTSIIQLFLPSLSIKMTKRAKTKQLKPKKYVFPHFFHTQKTYFNVYHWLNNIRCLIHSVVELRI